MNKYTITSTNFTGYIVIGYKNDVMGYFDFFAADLTQKQQSWLINNLPTHEGDLPLFMEQHKTLTHSLIPEDLSFDRFWNEYKYKIGNRKRSEKLWLELSEADKIKALQAIPRYNGFLKNRPSMERLYPETFLLQRRFENQF